MAETNSAAAPPDDRRTPLEIYFADFEEIIGMYTAKAIQLLPAKETEPLLRGLENAVRTQVRHMAESILGHYADAPLAQKDLWNYQFRLLGGPELTQAARQSIDSVVSPVGLTSFAAIFTLIKKLIKTLFPEGLGGLIDRVLEFIDEILESGILGAITRTGAQQRYEEERRYLDLQYYLARLERAQAERDAVLSSREE